ncbi:MAG: tRNA pseudouridine synthase A [Saprospiraceae bacterium]
MKIGLEISYDGTSYFGWQKQTGGGTVQQVVEEKLSILSGTKIDVIGCGRTDTGVHASQFYLHTELEESVQEKIKLYHLNSLLPWNISVNRIFRTGENFHSRFDANRRKYIYRLRTRKNPFHRNYCYQFLHESRIQLGRLEEVAAMILQTNDFSAFTKSNSGLNHFECQIHESQWVNPEPGVFEYHIAANRFVRGMVRLIVGSCLNYSLEKISLDTIGAQIQEKKQIDKSWSVPAQGLTLVEVDYPEAVKSLWIDFGI